MKVKERTTRTQTQLAVPINWEPDFFAVMPFAHVGEVYSKLREDFPGGGKSSMAQGEPTKAQVAEAVAETHSRGASFNYLINTTCMGNLEVTRRGYRKVRSLLDWLCTIGVDRVTLAMPFLVEIVKRHYPALGVTVSTQAGVTSLENLKYWEDLGADAVTLSHVEMNRNFRELRRIAANTSCQLQLIANMICKRRCPYVTLHGNFNAHSSQTHAKTNRYNMDYYFVCCLARSFSDPLSVIKANWIRPEDLHVYEQIGVRRFKIAERGLTTSALARIVGAYAARRYDGNFFDLVPTMAKYVFMQGGNFRRSVRELFRISFVNVLRLRDAVKRMRQLRASEDYYRDLGLRIDNRTLDGVIEAMIKKDCFSRVCDGCDYCETLVRECVHVAGGRQQLERDLGHLAAMVDGMVSGEYYSFTGVGRGNP